MQTAFARYTLHAELGSGATSVIYRGFDPHIGRMLAIKTLRREYAEREDYRQRFLTEARAAGTLAHPGIIAVFDAGANDGTPFIAMELIEGPDLDAFVRARGALPPRMVTRIVLQIADALDYAHRKGVVHQDIKPENIAVTSSNAGTVKVMDFGIARLRHGPRPAGAEGIAGTPHYMSPEQIRGGQVDGRSDLYSLGVLLYWLLAGRTPYAGEDVNALLRNILHAPLPALKPLDPATPDALVDVARALLAKDPAERYQTGAELVQELRHIDDVLAEQEDDWRGPRIIPLRVRWTALMGALVAVTVALGLALVHHKQRTAMDGLAFDYGLTLTQMLAVESAEDLLLGDDIAVQAMVDEMARNDRIVLLTIGDRDGRVVASTDGRLRGTALAPLPATRRLLQRGTQAVYALDAAGPSGFYLFESPVRYQRHELGRLRVGLSTAALDAANRTTAASMMAAMATILLTVFVGAYFLSRRLLIPIEILRAALRQVSRGSFDKRIRLRRRDEFGRLFAAYNAMADTLEARSRRESAAQPPPPPAPPTS